MKKNISILLPLFTRSLLIFKSAKNINGFSLQCPTGSSIFKQQQSLASQICYSKSNGEDQVSKIDNTGYEYSRCLRTPSQEKEQINAELILDQNLPKWKRLLYATSRGVNKGARSLSRRLHIGNEEGKPGTLILVRSGESEYTKNYTFTGWADPPLTSDNGVQQMEHAGRLLLESGYSPDIIYTSRLKRAIESVWVIVQEISAPYLPVYKSWRLNERHYGSLTGLSKKETSKKFGADVVQAWRRSLLARPPPATSTDWYHPKYDRKYSDLLPEQIPNSESLLDCMERTRSLWELKILKDLKRGDDVMVVAHGNALRGLAKIIDDIGEKEIADVTFPKGIPFVYKFDNKMKPIQFTDDKLTQAHSSGAFMEKVGLLKEAMKRQRQWEHRIPGGDDLPGIAKRMTTVENGLLKLREEQEWAKREEEDSSMNGSVKSEEDRFEEASIDKKQTNVVVNIKQVDVQTDPVVVLIRHGRTPHNKLALFTGWADPPLAPEGVEDARNAGRLLKQHGFEFDVVYSSWLYRAIQTAWFVLEEMDLLYLPLIKSWRLNERHYGALTGLSKKMVSNIHGEDQLKKWRKGYTVRPPQVSSYSLDYPGNDERRIKHVKDLRISLSESLFRSIEQRKPVLHRKFPKGESLKDTMERSIPFYTKKIVPETVANGKRVLITSHENAIRGILMHLCEIPEENMNELNLPNGVPLIYNVRRKCISLLDDGTGEDPLEKYNFGSAAQYLFRPCELVDDDFDTEDEKLMSVGT